MGTGDEERAKSAVKEVALLVLAGVAMAVICSIGLAACIGAVAE